MRPQAEGLGQLAIARALREIGRLRDLAGAKPFEARAYERGARVLERADLSPTRRRP
jgi:DNA polymerase/3'-5' exonuclease PolX